jgi:hypothetical protein
VGARTYAWLYTALVIAAAATVTYAITRYPGVLDDPAATVYLVILIVTFAAYAYLAVRFLARDGSVQVRRTGTAFGLVAGALWLAEIWFQAPAGLPSGAERTVPAICAAAAALVTLAAGIVEGILTRDRRCAVLVGLWTGAVSGTVMTIGMIAIQLSNLSLLGARADYQAELARSGGTDMATYLAGDAIAATLAHMILNVLLAMVGAGIGVAVAAAARTASSRAS